MVSRRGTIDKFDTFNLHGKLNIVAIFDMFDMVNIFSRINRLNKI